MLAPIVVHRESRAEVEARARALFERVRLSHRIQPTDPNKQKRVLAGLYGVQASPVDDRQCLSLNFRQRLLPRPALVVRWREDRRKAPTLRCEKDGRLA